MGKHLFYVILTILMALSPILISIGMTIPITIYYYDASFI
jgi:hypothetical protein